jgi:hypothetical protein
LKSGEAAYCFKLLGGRAVVLPQSFSTQSIASSSLSRLKFLNCRDGSGVLGRAYLMERGAKGSLTTPLWNFAVFDDDTFCAAQLTPQRIDNSGIKNCPVRQHTSIATQSFKQLAVLTCPGRHIRHHVRLSSNPAHAQVHPQPPPRSSPNGRVSAGNTNIGSNSGRQGLTVAI